MRSSQRPHEQRRHPHREVDRRLHLPLVRQEVPDHGAAGGGRDPLGRSAGEPRSGVRGGRAAPTAGACRSAAHRVRPPCSTSGRTRSSAPSAAGGWCGRAAATRAGTAGRTPAARNTGSNPVWAFPANGCNPGPTRGLGQPPSPRPSQMVRVTRRDLRGASPTGCQASCCHEARCRASHQFPWDRACRAEWAR